MKELSRERSPTWIVDEQLSARGIVKFLWHPDYGLIESAGRYDFCVIDRSAVGRPVGICVVLHVSIVSTRFNDADFGSGHPGALVVANSRASIRHHSHSVGCAKAGAVDFASLSVGRYFHDRSGLAIVRIHACFGIVEIAVRVALKIKIEGMKESGYVVVCAEGFVEVSFSVAIEIMEAS